MAYTLTTNKSWAQTEAELKTVLGRWGAKEYVLTRGQKKDGTPVRPNAVWHESPEEATVRLTIRWASGRELTLAYNLQRRSQDNLRVLFLAVDSLRLNELRGIDDLLREAYAQLPAGPATPIRRSPYEVLNLSPNAPMEVAEASYRALAKLRHPDVRGGSESAMAELNEAIETLRKGQTPL